MLLGQRLYREEYMTEATEAFVMLDPQIQVGCLLAAFIAAGFALQSLFELLKLWITKRYEK